MPKRGAKNRGYNWSGNRNGNFHSEHDDRISDGTRRVSFKPNKDRHSAKPRNFEASIRAHLEDEDIDMTGQAGPPMVRFMGFRGGRGNRGRRGGGNGGRNSPLPGGPSMHRKLLPGPLGWYQVIVVFGAKYDKSYIIKELLNKMAPDGFIPLYYKMEKNNATFFVDDFNTAEKLFRLDRAINTPDGFRLMIRVKTGSPQVILDEAVRERMKLAMAKRYNPATKSLDLSRFHADSDLCDMYCALARPVMFTAAVDIVAANIPELEALNLDENRIHVTESLRCLPQKLPNIKVLHMKNNKIMNIPSLEALKGLPLVELVLEGNPVKKKFIDNNSYVSTVRKHLPKLMKLDGMDMPPIISFDVADSVELPPAHASFLCATEGGDVVRQFLQQYFSLYDSDSRQPLLEAYHEHAMLSMTTFTNKPSEYTRHNRNLLRNRDSYVRLKHLHQGRLRIVSLLSELPKTQHDPMSFAVDLSLFTPSLLLLSVTGVFRELGVGQKPSQLRSFHRSLVIVPAGSGFCIRNETIFINNATPAQERASFQPASGAPVNATTSSSSSSLNQSVPDVLASVPISDSTKQQMVLAMCQQSNMNIDWSEKCLAETNWDYQRALYVFTELHKQGTIPAEAFVK